MKKSSKKSPSPKVTALKKHFKQFKKSKYFFASILSGILALFLLLTAGLTFAIYSTQVSSGNNAQYQLLVTAENLEDDTYTLIDSTQFDIRIKENSTQLFFQKYPELLIQATVQDKELVNTTYLPDKDTSDILLTTITLDPLTLSEGEHQLTIMMKEKESGKIVDEKTIQILNDHTWPTLLSATIDNNKLTLYDVEQAATSEAVAVISTKAGIRQLKNTNGPFAIVYNFSEPVELSGGKQWNENVLGESGSLVFTATTEATLSATLTTTSSSFKQQIVFKDRVGHELATELQFTLDAQAPKLTVLDEEPLIERAVPFANLVFLSSEPLASAKATINGVTLTAAGGTERYFFKGLPYTLGKNTVSIVAYDYAGNMTKAEQVVEVIPNPQGIVKFGSDGQGANRKCTQEDLETCGYTDFLNLTCEKFYQARDCLLKRCNQNRYNLQGC